MDTLCKAKKLQAMNNYYYYNYFVITWFLHNIILNLLIAFTFSTLFCSYSYWFPFFKKLVFGFCPNFLFVVVNVIVVFLLGESKLIGYSNSSSSTSEIYDEYVERSRNFRGLCFQGKTAQSKLEFKNLIMSSEQEIKVVKEVIESSMQQQEQEREEEEEKEEDFKVDQEEFQDDRELEFDQDEAQDQEIKVKEVQDLENEVKEFKHQENKVKEEAKDQEDEEIRDGEDQENELMPTEELNRRVEEFIARVNKQRWLEEVRLLVCCRA